MSIRRRCANYSVDIIVCRGEWADAGVNNVLCLLMVSLVLCVKVDGRRLPNSYGNWICLSLQPMENNSNCASRLFYIST